MKKYQRAKARIVTIELAKHTTTSDYMVYLAFSSTASLSIPVTEGKAKQISERFQLDIETRTAL